MGETIAVFTSYAHVDDDNFGIINPLRQLLGAVAKAKYGIELNFFIDREKLTWGSSWQDEIDRAIQASSIFIPLLSANYLESKACRDEFLAYYHTASTRSASDLILPILIMDAPEIFNVDSGDEVAKIASQLQYICIEDATLAEPNSQVWKRTANQLATRLKQSLDRVEANLTLQSKSLTRPQSGEENLIDADDLEAPGLIDLIAESESVMSDISKTTDDVSACMGDLDKAATAVNELPTPRSAKELQRWSIRAASMLSEPSRRLEALGETLYSQCADADRTLRAAAEHHKALNEGSTNEVINTDSLKPIAETREALYGMIESMEPLERLSLVFRKAIRPARIGATKIADSASIIGTWSELGF